MNDIFNAVKLDYYILKAHYWRIILVTTCLAILASIGASNPTIIILIVATTSAFLMGTLFSTVEKNNLTNLYGVLPVGKNEIVLGRYLFTLLVGVLNIFFAAVLALIISMISGLGGTDLVAVLPLCGSFLVFCGFVAIQFPIYFAFDYSKVSAITTLPITIIAVIGAPRLAKNPQVIGQVTTFINTHPWAVWLIGIGGGLLLLGISAFLSTILYKKRQS